MNFDNSQFGIKGNVERRSVEVYSFNNDMLSAELSFQHPIPKQSKAYIRGGEFGDSAFLVCLPQQIINTYHLSRWGTNFSIMSERKMSTAEVGEHMEQQRNMDVEEIFTPQFGNWEVRDDGEILYHGSEIAIKEIPAIGLENLHLTQMLSKFRTGKSDDATEFYFAYLEALKKAGYKSLTIDLTHIHNIKFEK